MIDLYTSPTPNGWKAAMALEELKLPYNVKYIDLALGEQRTPEFLAMNLNGRIPVIVDHEVDDLVVSTQMQFCSIWLKRLASCYQKMVQRGTT